MFGEEAIQKEETKPHKVTQKADVGYASWLGRIHFPAPKFEFTIAY